MDQDEFDKYNDVVERVISKKISEYHRIIETSKDDDNWGHSNWLCHTWETEEFISGIDEGLYQLAELHKLHYERVDMKVVNARLFNEPGSMGLSLALSQIEK